MVLTAAVVLVAVYAVAASWAVGCGGPRRLWLTAAATLGLLAAAAILLGRHYTVPSQTRLLLVVMELTGPAVIAPTVLLSVWAAPGATWAGRLAMAVLGAGAGLMFGWLLVIFGLRVW